MSKQPTHSAILIDADNIDPIHFDKILQKCKKEAYPIIKRAYGDFSKGKAQKWIPLLSTHGISPYQNFAVANGKNAADISLVVDAMDILHEDQVNTFCLISSDSDFSRLATRIKERGKAIFGFGISNTPEAFQNACDRFDIIKEKPAKPSTTTKFPCANAFKKIKAAIVSLKKNNDGYVHVGPLGKALKAENVSYKNYDAKSFIDMLEKIPEIEVNKSATPIRIRIRLRPAKE